MLRRWGALLVAGLAMAACNTTYSSAYYERAFTGRELDSYGAGRDFNTVVIGDPFGMGEQAFGDALRGQLIRDNAYRKIYFTDMPDETASNYKLVFALNPSQTVGLQTLCRDAASVATDPPGPEIRMSGALRHGDAMLTFLDGRLAATPAGPDDEEFQQFVKSFMQQLTPTFNPRRTRRSGAGA